MSMTTETRGVMSGNGVWSMERVRGCGPPGQDTEKAQPRLSHHRQEGIRDPLITIVALPVELVLKIFEGLDFESALRLSETCKKFHGVFKTHKEALILSIFPAQLSPFDTLLQCVVQKGEDLDVPLGPCLRRRIYHRGKLVSEGERPDPSEEAHQLLPPVSLDQEHFKRLVSAYRLVDEWEQLFPQYRFHDHASDCRELRPNEKERLRRAIYRWMSYAQYFHGDFKRPSRNLPVARSDDIRCKKLRVLSTVELIELEDLWETVVSIVSSHICPSTEQVMDENDGKLSTRDAENLSFGSSEALFLRSWSWHETTTGGRYGSVNHSIVETFLKLLPQDILHFATSRFVYTRDKVIREVLLSYPSILQDQQTLGHAIAAVKKERFAESWAAKGNWNMLCMALSPVHGGILDAKEPGSWPDDDTLRRSFDRQGDRALGWLVDEGAEWGGVRGAVMERGRLEP